MQNHVWISLALFCLLCQSFCDNKNGCTSRKIEIADKKLLLRLKGANATGPEILTANTADICVQLCCEKKVRCNIVEFRSTLVTNNCIHAFCHPISKCLEDDPDKSNGTTATYQLVKVERRAGQRSINATTEQSKGSQISSRSIKSRKGVGETAAPLNASSTERQEYIRTDATKDNQTKEPESSTTNLMSTAQPSDLGNTTDSISAVMDGTVEATTIEDSTAKTDYPDLDADKMKHVVPRKGASDDHTWASYSTPASILQPMDQQPRPPIPTKQIQSNNPSTPNDANATEFSTTSLTEPSSTVDRPTIATITSTYHEKLPLKNYNISNATTNAFTSEAAQRGQEPKSVKHVIQQTMSSKLPPVKLVVSGSIDFMSSHTTVVAAQSLDELHFQQSIYLILSLIIGFLVLLLVIGMVLKHVYGVWERRHYQRMDFLIDGLYNSRSAI